MINWTKSRRSVGSSVSSKARAAARSAELAKLKLEQAERRAKTKQKQMQKQIEQKLQDLRDQAEYSQLEAHLLAADQAGDRFSDRSSKRSWPKIPPENKANIKIEIEGATTKHENTCEASPSLIPHDSTTCHHGLIRATQLKLCQRVVSRKRHHPHHVSQLRTVNKTLPSQ